MNLIIETLNEWGAHFASFTGAMVWQSAILISGLLVLDWLLRKKVRATVRYAVWMLVLVKLVLPPSLTLPTGVAYWLPAPAAAPIEARVARSQPVRVVPASAPGNLTVGVATPARAVSSVSPVSQAAPVAGGPAMSRAGWLFAGWLAVSLGLCLWVGWRLRRVVRVVAETVAAPSETDDLLAACCRQMGITTPVALRCSIDSLSPAICGWFRPVIVIPASFPQTLGRAEMRSILLHELAHLKRGDLWISHAQILLQVIYWFHPLVWLANAVIRRVREQAVDEMVRVELGEEADVYPETLLQVARMSLHQPAVSIGFVGILETGSALRQRIRRMLAEPVPATARLGFRALAFLAVLGLLALPMGFGPAAGVAAAQVAARSARPAAPVAATKLGPASEAAKGIGLTEAQVAEKEAALAADPENISLRSQLLGYYGGARYKSDAARVTRQGHILWLIERHPEAPVLGTPYGTLNSTDGSVCSQGMELFLKQAQKHAGNATVLGNAAAYCLLNDQLVSERLYLQAQALEPRNPGWSGHLAQLYSLAAKFPSVRGIPDAAAKALAQMERAQADTTEAVTRFSNLNYLARMAYDAGDLTKAGNYAAEMLREAKNYPDHWAAGNGQHNGNAVLGRIALQAGRVNDARQYLLAAGHTKGSPVLNTSGPNMTLARELLGKGEKETVLEYLKLCGDFWKSGAGKLDRWAKEINAGLVPDFGTNLVL